MSQRIPKTTAEGKVAIDAFLRGYHETFEDQYKDVMSLPDDLRLAQHAQLHYIESACKAIRHMIAINGQMGVLKPVKKVAAKPAPKSRKRK